MVFTGAAEGGIIKLVPSFHPNRAYSFGPTTNLCPMNICKADGHTEQLPSAHAYSMPCSLPFICSS